MAEQFEDLAIEQRPRQRDLEKDYCYVEDEQGELGSQPDENHRQAQDT